VKKDVAKKEELKFDYTDALNLECRLTEDEKMVRNVFHDYCQVKTPSLWSAGPHRTRRWSGFLPGLLSGKNAISLECRLTEDEKMVRNVFHDYCQVKMPSVWSVSSPRTRRWSGMSSTTIVR
jgi:hypothetical protein